MSSRRPTSSSTRSGSDSVPASPTWSISLSEDPDIDGYAARKRALRKGILESGGDPVIIYAADRVANMRDWHKIAPEDRPACGERLGTTLDERLELWTEDVEELHDLDPQTPFLGEIESELAALKAETRPR